MLNQKGFVATGMAAIAPLIALTLVAIPSPARSAGGGEGFYSMSSQVSRPTTAMTTFFQAIAAEPETATWEVSATGEQVSLNGRLLALPWQMRNQQIGLSDISLLQQMGFHLLDTPNPSQQPVHWFSTESAPVVLGAWGDRQFRYLDIASLAATYGWQLQPSGNILQIKTPIGSVSGIRSGQQPRSDRIVLDLSQPVTTQLTQSPGTFNLTVDATTPAVTLAEFNRRSSSSQIQITSTTQQTVLQGSINSDRQVRVWSLSNPDRLVIDIRADSLVPQNIQWAAGLGWHQQYISVSGQTFPVYWLAVDPTDPQLKLRPIWSDSVTVVGTTPLTTMARRWQAAAAINAGFFNRNNRLPLGAIRSDGRWISGPILGRGAVGWTDAGEVLIDRLALRQTLVTAAGESIAVQGINTGYVQAGVGLYSADWGAAYTPITGSETLARVESGAVVGQVAASPDSTTMIPLSGFLLAVRTHLAIASQLTPGTQLTLETEVIPAAFSDTPYVASGGPLLLSRGTNVLNPQAESFSAAFGGQAAPRSAIGRTATGQVLLAAVHVGAQGRGPTLAELSVIMEQLGCVDALNLDGGSSASLYLGGTLINRPPQSAARINNAIGIFLQP
ncbi:phosphodiester glycosidase family protein [Almyronema epifaneia]|uniref:Phosphodiester glycosidase family protein n=1 Tax=Almyronema epifaneia S1 TaxID=2991925 RepID=A0ABW6IHF9_9CYAN